MIKTNYNKIQEVKKEINKYYGEEVDDVFKVEQELNAIYMDAIITTENYPIYIMNITRDDESIIIKKESDDSLEVQINNKFHSKIIYRNIIENGCVQILCFDTRRSDDGTEYKTEGRIVYFGDGVFKEEEKTTNKFTNGCFSSCTHIFTRNIKDSFLIKMIENSDIEEPSRDKVSHFFNDGKNSSGMDSRSKGYYIRKPWIFIKEDEYYKYLIDNIKPKTKVKK